nr:ionotropic receptor [Odontothrips loti]
MTMMLLISFFIFTSFGAFIVALLQAPATPLSSPQELLASSIKISAMDVAFIHAWFRGEVGKPTRGVVGDIFVKKIKIHERPGFLPVWEGIELVRRRGYGYQAEMNEAYHEIQEKFTEAEKCDLFEMELFPSEAQIIVTVEKSPYREVFSRFVRWQRELGLLDRISKRWYASRPRCEEGSRGLQAIGVREVVPLLLLLTYGVLLSLVFLAMEILSRHRRPRTHPPRPLWSLPRWRRLLAFGGRSKRRRGAAPGPPGLGSPCFQRRRPHAQAQGRRRGAATVTAHDALPVPPGGELYRQTRSLALGHFAADLHRRAMVKIDVT